MRRQILTAALFAVPVLAQANAVPGLDILMYELTDLSYYGRQGAAYPNGEAGFMVGHSWCNGGSVNLPWVSTSGGVMVDMYPRIAFLLARESDGRMVQITNNSFCKHSPVPFNFSSGPCAPCNTGSGAFFFVGCSDTYGAGINSSQYALGPTIEIDPWLGTWNPQGSYFDQGDPSVGGAAAMDSARSLTSAQIAGFGPVKNRMQVLESELVAGATYYGQIQAVVQGEPVGERSNNVMNRQMSISGTGSGWNTATAGPSQLGSVLTRWTGATTDIGGNGQDDGRFLVGVKVTGPVAGMYHYEYAIHNIDNNRGAASFRVPMAIGGVVQNAGFRDIDSDPLNDWQFSQTANEIAFTAVGSNRLVWNTIYNCWFDCSIPPGAGSMTIDQALPGTGAIDVQVPSRVPSGLAFANKFTVGESCGECTGTFYERFATTAAFDLAGRSMTLTLQNGAYAVSEPAVSFVPVAGVNLALGLNGVTTVSLPFSLPYPGGSATQLGVASCGYVSPGVAFPSQLSPNVAQLLAGNPRWAVAWTIFNPTAASANNVWFDANPSRAILTWSNVPIIGSTSPNTCQLQLFPDGTAHVLWQTIASTSLPLMVGWSSGGGYSDPGPRDLSASLPTPFGLCAAPFDGLTLDADALPVLGATLDWQIGGVPAGTGFGALLRSVEQAVPAIDLTAAGMPGCQAHVLSPVATFFVTPPSSLQLAETIPNNAALIGIDLVGQAVTYNPTLNPAGLVWSNGVVLSLGL